jgi:hypothetical protein
MTRSTAPKRGKHGGHCLGPYAVTVALREMLARDASAQLRDHRSQLGTLVPQIRLSGETEAKRCLFGRESQDGDVPSHRVVSS